MATTTQESTHEPSKAQDKGITALTVRGFKSLYEETRLKIRPLTILAGANSSGKSSAMQPLLLLKQTLEAPYDPGALLLHGPNLRFTAADQLFSRTPGRKSETSYRIAIELDSAGYLGLLLRKGLSGPVEIGEMAYQWTHTSTLERSIDRRDHTKDDILTPHTDQDDLVRMAPAIYPRIPIPGQPESKSLLPFKVIVHRERCMLAIWATHENRPQIPVFEPGKLFEPDIVRVIHVPGLRGNPERTYNTSAIGPNFPGLFDSYLASIIHYWQISSDARLGRLEEALEALGLTSRVEARPVEDTRVELRVGRLPHGGRNGAKDLVSIADVGFGVSQVLPVLVALLVAEPGRLVYIEQPELHLHPRAQVALAGVLADAARRGVRVVIETHSSLLLLAVQSLVAEGTLSPDLVKLHWFQRRKDGVSEVRSADLDDAGAFGDWPEDFADVSLEAQNHYLTAAESRLRAR